MRDEEGKRDGWIAILSRAISASAPSSWIEDVARMSRAGGSQSASSAGLPP